MARLGEMNEHGLVLTDDDGDRLVVHPIRKPNLVLLTIPGLGVVLDEERVRALVEFLQGQLANR